MKKQEYMKLHILPRYVQAGMLLSGKTVDSVNVNEKIVTINGKQYDSSKKVIVKVPLKIATMVDL